MKINYVIATWSGKRKSDCSLHIKHHLEHLSKLDHNLTQITIGYPHNPRESKYYANCIARFSNTKMNGTPVVLFRTKNLNLSYGQYMRVYAHYRDKFDYYIIIEDDYVPVQHNFDKILVDIYKKMNCAYLCSSAACTKSVPYHHATVSNGIISAESFANICSKKLFWKDHRQLAFSNFFLKDGGVLDYTRWYRTLYWPHKNRIVRVYGDINKDDLISPIEYVLFKNRYKLVSYPYYGAIPLI